MGPYGFVLCVSLDTSEPERIHFRIKGSEYMKSYFPSDEDFARITSRNFFLTR